MSQKIFMDEKSRGQRFALICVCPTYCTKTEFDLSHGHPIRTTTVLKTSEAVEFGRTHISRDVVLMSGTHKEHNKKTIYKILQLPNNAGFVVMKTIYTRAKHRIYTECSDAVEHGLLSSFVKSLNKITNWKESRFVCNVCNIVNRIQSSQHRTCLQIYNDVYEFSNHMEVVQAPVDTSRYGEPIYGDFNEITIRAAKPLGTGLVEEPDKYNEIRRLSPGYALLAKAVNGTLRENMMYSCITGKLTDSGMIKYAN